MNKPVVHYTEAVSMWAGAVPIRVGNPAHVYTTDHPSPLVSNKGLVRTSPVIRVDYQTGEFETQNTIYKKA